MQRVGFLIYTGSSIMGLAVGSVFEVANIVGERTAYELVFLSENGGPIETSAGLVVNTTAFEGVDLDTLIINGRKDPVPSLPRTAMLLKEAADRFRRLAAVGGGSLLLAEAGLLDGRRATTHRVLVSQMQRQFPLVNVEEDRIFVRDGPIWTCAGMAAGLDLGLALVEDDVGSELARSVARKLLIHHRRRGAQPQISALLDLQPKSDRIQRALDHARQNLSSRLNVEDLAEVASLSPRQFSRAFVSETGQSPAKAVEQLRVEAARLMMEQSRHPIDYVAVETGFGDRHRMRQAFLRAFGESPQVVRRSAKLSANAPELHSDGATSRFEF